MIPSTTPKVNAVSVANENLFVIFLILYIAYVANIESTIANINLILIIKNFLL